MTFEDLPPDWGDNPITPELMPDVVDLFVKGSDRVAGCLSLLLVTADHELMQPFTLERFAPDEAPDDAEAFLASLSAIAGEVGGTYVVARGRTGPAVVTPDDVAWFEPVRRGLGNQLLAAFIATGHGDVVPFDLDAAA